MKYSVIFFDLAAGLITINRGYYMYTVKHELQMIV